jgi:hypothetical protein
VQVPERTSTDQGQGTDNQQSRVDLEQALKRAEHVQLVGERQQLLGLADCARALQLGEDARLLRGRENARLGTAPRDASR